MKENATNQIPNMDNINIIVKKTKVDEAMASEWASNLSRYKKTKKENKKKLTRAIKKAQIDFKFE